ncbi:hypothetical protein DBZ36_10705 [Alginatibacterium sediminis]|uniref:Cytoplasmic protein n=1 Tax=Alginatibacterium sediminis TaxID=2164068 RepID=A0A420EDV4_9ALTE|nr:DUF3820 family protein [Alginatibacterium sediminis]RKF18850.1 hypothetical protein DBZ36_10705 [Alginatibacterium sediminis]
MNEQNLAADPEILIKIARTRMPFGKYTGTAIVHLPEEYLLWFQNKDGFPKGELGYLMAICLELKVEGLESLLLPLAEKKPKSFKFD